MSDNDVEFDPTILQHFEREIANWPPEQAVEALRLVRGVIAGDASAKAVLDIQTGEFGPLTGAQLERVRVVLRKMFGDWTH